MHVRSISQWCVVCTKEACWFMRLQCFENPDFFGLTYSSGFKLALWVLGRTLHSFFYIAPGVLSLTVTVLASLVSEEELLWPCNVFYLMFTFFQDKVTNIVTVDNYFSVFSINSSILTPVEVALKNTGWKTLWGVIDVIVSVAAIWPSCLANEGKTMRPPPAGSFSWTLLLHGDRQ